MKKVSTMLVILFMAGLGFVHAEATKQKNSLLVNPTILLMDIFSGAIEIGSRSYSLSMEWQYAITPHTAFALRPNFFMSESSTISSAWLLLGNSYSAPLKIDDHSFNVSNMVVSIMPGVVFRPFGGGLRGWYIGIYPNIGWENIKYDRFDPDNGRTIDDRTTEVDESPYVAIGSIDDHFLILGGGIESGYTFVFGSGFSLMSGIGIERNWAVISRDEVKGIYKKGPKGLYDMRLVFMLGYSF